MSDLSSENGKRNPDLLSTEDSRSLEYVFKLLWNNRKSILRITLIATILSGMYAFIMPQTFTSSVSLLPPQTEERGGGLAEILSGNTQLFDLGATLGFGGRPSDVFVDILKSRTVAETLIVRNRLQEYFGYPLSSSRAFVIEPLQNATNIESAKDGLITIAVSLSTSFFASNKEMNSIKQLAADVANGYAIALDQTNRSKLVSKAKNSRLYLEVQLQKTRSDLDSAYGRLVSFQRSSNLLSLDKQLDGFIRAASEIKTRLVEAEVELGFGQQDLKKSSRALLEAHARVDAIQKQYENLLSGNQTGSSDYVIGLTKLPQIGRELANLLREVKILEEINAFLNRQYYKEKVQEARDLPTVQILDPAVPAHVRTSPRRLMWILLSFFLSFVIGCIFVIVRESILVSRIRIAPRKTKS